MVFRRFTTPDLYNEHIFLVNLAILSIFVIEENEASETQYPNLKKVAIDFFVVNCSSFAKNYNDMLVSSLVPCCKCFCVVKKGERLSG